MVRGERYTLTVGPLGFGYLDIYTLKIGAAGPVEECMY